LIPTWLSIHMLIEIAYNFPLLIRHPWYGWAPMGHQLDFAYVHPLLIPAYTPVSSDIDVSIHQCAARISALFGTALEQNRKEAQNRNPNLLASPKFN